MKSASPAFGLTGLWGLGWGKGMDKRLEKLLTIFSLKLYEYVCVMNKVVSSRLKLKYLDCLQHL